MNRRLPALLVLAWPVVATAQDALIERYGPILESCYTEAVDAGSRRACEGTMADACIEHEADGQSTLGMANCNRAEAAVWDRYLNAQYRATKAALQEADEEDARYEPELAHRVETLRDAQRAWIAYRDAECHLAYALWGGGSFRNVAASACLRRMTAERTVELSKMRENFQ